MPKEWQVAELREIAEGGGLSPLAISALRLVADLFELADDDRVSPELIGIRVRNQLNHL